MRWVALTAFIILFAHSVTLKYAPTGIYFAPDGRYAIVLKHRPAIPVIVYMNTHHLDGKLFQSWMDEYRAWIQCDVIGRRVWANSWHEYHTLHPDNTAVNLYEWLASKDVTHFVVAPNGKFELPYRDECFGALFHMEAYYQNYILFRLKTSPDEECPDPINLAELTPAQIRYVRDDRSLQE